MIKYITSIEKDEFNEIIKKNNTNFFLNYTIENENDEILEKSIMHKFNIYSLCINKFKYINNIKYKLIIYNDSFSYLFLFYENKLYNCFIKNAKLIIKYKHIICNELIVYYNKDYKYTNNHNFFYSNNKNTIYNKQIIKNKHILKHYNYFDCYINYDNYNYRIYYKFLNYKIFYNKGLGLININKYIYNFRILLFN